jgi:spore germination protein KC
MNLKRITGIIILCFIFCGFLTSCYDKREIDELTYVIAIGLDKGNLNDLKLTLQYAIPAAIGGGGSSGGGGGPETVGVVTLEAPTIYSGLNMANNFMGKQINISHAEVAVFSEELAKSSNMHDYIHAMVRGREFRPNMNIAISRTSAEDYIKSVKPIQETDPAKYYELKFSTYKYTGFTANSQLGVFYNEQQSASMQAVATLVGVSTNESSKDIDAGKSTYQEKERDKPLMGDYVAGNIPRAGDVKGETMGLAAFDGANMVGELDGQEATMYLITSGQYRNSYVTFPDPKAKGSYVVLNLKQSRKPQYNVDIKNGKPKINVKLRLEGDFLSIQSGINYEEDGLLTVFENSAEQFLKNEILRLLNRTTKEFHSDICGFGKNVKGKFLTWDEWIKFNWLGRYKDSTFNIDVDVKVRRPGLMIRSVPAISSKGTEN